MLKLKVFMLLMLVLILAGLLTGCGLVFNQAADSEEIWDGETQLPEWLLLAHRDVKAPQVEVEDEAEMQADLEEAELQEAAEPSVAAEAAPAVTQQPAPSAPAATSTGDDEDDSDSGLTRSQQMLVQSWQRDSTTGGQDRQEPGTEGEWWEVKSEPSSNNFWER